MARARRTEYIPFLVRFELRIEIYQYEWRRRNDYFNQKDSLVDDSDSSKSTDTPKSKPIFHLLKNIRPWNVASRRRCCVALRDVGVIPPAYFLQITGVTVPVICPCAYFRVISGFESQRVTTWDARSLTRIPVCLGSARFRDRRQIGTFRLRSANEQPDNRPADPLFLMSVSILEVPGRLRNLSFSTACIPHSKPLF